MKLERQKVRAVYKHACPVLTGTLAEIRDEVAELITAYGEAAEIDIIVEASYDEEREASVYLYDVRDETDAELARRQAEFDRRLADTEERERQEYTRLAAKFAPRPGSTDTDS